VVPAAQSRLCRRALQHGHRWDNRQLGQPVRTCMSALFSTPLEYNSTPNTKGPYSYFFGIQAKLKALRLSKCISSGDHYNCLLCGLLSGRESFCGWLLIWAKRAMSLCDFIGHAPHSQSFLERVQGSTDTAFVWSRLPGLFMLDMHLPGVFALASAEHVCRS